MQRILIGTRHKAWGAQLQNSMHGTFFATTKYKTQLNLTRKIIPNMHDKKTMHLKLKNN